MTIFRTLSPKDSISVALRNCSKEAREGVRLHTSLQQSGQAVWITKIIIKLKNQVKELSYQISDIKLKNLALFYIWKDARVWDYWSHFLHIHLSYLGPASCLFDFSNPPTPPASMDNRCCVPFGSPHSHLEAPNCWWLLSSFTDMTGDIPLHRVLHRRRGWELRLEIGNANKNQIAQGPVEHNEVSGH